MMRAHRFGELAQLEPGSADKANWPTGKREGVNTAPDRRRSRGGGLLAEDLERLRDYGESGWEIDHVVAHGENQNAMLFVFKRVTDVPV
jgi:hypothetical protein